MVNQQENKKKSFDPHLMAVHESMMKGLGQLADYFGFNRVMGELYATLLLNPDPMSLDDLKDRVHKSKASVSMNTRTLEYMGAVNEVWIREDNPSNRKFYEAESDFWKILSQRLGTQELKDIDLAIGVMEENVARLENAQSDMDEEDRTLSDFYVNRMKLLVDFFKFAKLLLTTILEQATELNVSEVSRVDIE